MEATAALAYSKKQIDKSGRLVRNFLADFRAGASLDAYPTTDVDRAIQVVQDWRSAHARPLARVNANLRYYVRKVNADPEVTQRLKRFSTIIDKLQREPTMQLSKMEDIAGVRAILPTQEQVDAIRHDIERQSRWNIRRVRDYVDGPPGPKQDGYRAVHVIIEKDGCYVEIQLRTPWQDVWAQSVEQDTRRLRAGLKFGAGPDDLREYYRRVSELFAMRERGEEPDRVFMADLAKLYGATRRYFPDQPGQNGDT